MNIQEAKQIKIADYLQSLGHRPVKQHGANLWYKSPLRNESEPSFKVNTTMNSWFDFGMGKGGNIITLASYLYASDSLPYLLDKMEKQAPHVRPTDFSFIQQASEPSFERLEVRELNHPALLRYLSERKINLHIARRNVWNSTSRMVAKATSPSVSRTSRAVTRCATYSSRAACHPRTSPISDSKASQDTPATCSRV